MKLLSSADGETGPDLLDYGGKCLLASFRLMLCIDASDSIYACLAIRSYSRHGRVRKPQARTSVLVYRSAEAFALHWRMRCESTIATYSACLAQRSSRQTIFPTAATKSRTRVSARLASESVPKITLDPSSELYLRYPRSIRHHQRT